jgi:hypothetical protein
VNDISLTSGHLDALVPLNVFHDSRAKEQNMGALTTQDLSYYYIWRAPYSLENRSWPLNQFYSGSGSSFSKNPINFFG